MRVLSLLLLLIASLARAESLPDPTRPPKAFGDQPAAAAAETPGESTPQLQSVLLPREGRPMAIIDGRAMYLGDPVAGGRLVRLSETEAVIRMPEGLLRLQLTPEAEKKTIQEKKGAQSPKKAGKNHE